MQAKRFNHFIVAGVIAMASAGLVTVNDSSTARVIRLAEMDSASMPMTQQFGNRVGPSGLMPGAAPPIGYPTGSTIGNGGGPSPFMMQRQGTQEGGMRPSAPDMRPLGNDQGMMLKKAAEGQGWSHQEGMPSDASGGSGPSQEAVQKDVMKQFGTVDINSDVMNTIKQQLMESDDEDDSDDACDMVAVAITEMGDRIEAESAKRIAMYTASRDKATSATVKKIWETRLAKEDKRKANLLTKLETRATALEEKYGCTDESSSDL